MRILHTADLQIGARFLRFGPKAGVLREARLETLGRILDLGREKSVDAILIAGDLFESNQIADPLVEKVFGVLAEHPGIPIIILPGNHDPLDGPGCIWLREPFSDPPPQVTVCTTRENIEVAGAVILPVPITQKVSTRDPSLPLVENVAALAEGRIRIGMTHGALAIEGKHQPNDQPVALNAATRAGLDYLALGHWHRPQSYDDGRLAMPGTPEPDDFGQDSGTVSLVEIPGPGRTPDITPIDCATFAWKSVTLDLLNRDPTPDWITAALNSLDTDPRRTVLRIELVGPVSADRRESLEAHLSQAGRQYAAVLVEDQTSTVLSESLWKACLREHPLLAQVVADVERSRWFNTGRPPTAHDSNLADLTLEEFRSLCSDLKIEPDAMDSDVFDSMIALLSTEMGRTGGAGGSP